LRNVNQENIKGKKSIPTPSKALMGRFSGAAFEFGFPQCGQAGAESLISLLHSLHFISAMSASLFNNEST
jgi:hypothetical protein